MSQRPGLEPPSPLPPPDPRRRLERSYVDREISVLERLRDRTRDPARLADVLHRLAETLSDSIRLDETAARQLDQPIFEARRAGQAVRLRRLTERQRQAEASAREGHQRVIDALVALVRAQPDRPGVDGSLFTLAYHAEHLGQSTQARQVYRRLIRDYPDSAYVPHAYLAFGDYYFQQEDLTAAREFYARVLDIPPERNAVYGYARYKLAWVLYNQESFAASLDAFVATLQFAEQHPERPDSTALANQVRREIVLPYSRVGRPDRALAFFTRVAADEDGAIAMLEALATLYHDMGEWPHSISTHHRLMAARPSSESLCAWQSRIFDATVASRPKSDQVREGERLVAIQHRLAESDAPTAASCDDTAAASLILLATAWHREAIGTDESPGTRETSTMDAAADLYALILREFDDLDQMTLSSIDARDRPTYGSVAFFAGELLYERQRWAECAEAFERVLDHSDDPQLAADAAYVAVLCYDRHMGTRQPADREPERGVAERALSDDELRMSRTFARFVCTATDHEELPVVLYRWARLEYEANRFDEAAVLFRRVAFDHRQSEVAEYAANLYLDSLNMLYERRRHDSCVTELAAATQRLEDAYCNGDQAARHPDLCTTAHTLRCQLEARRAEGLGERGEHEPAGRLYVRLVRELQCPDAPTYLYNAGIQFEAARLIGPAIRVRSVLAESFPDDPLAQRSQFLIGANYHALAIYELAADWYERYAGTLSREACAERDGVPCPDAAEGLSNAIFFRMGLGQDEEAEAGVRLFERTFGRRQPAQAAAVAFALGAVYERREDWSGLVEHQRRFLRQYARHADPALLAGAHIQIARAQVRLGDRREAEPHLRAVIEVFEDGGETALMTTERPSLSEGAPPPPPSHRVGFASGSEAERLQAVYQLRNAVAEAYFELAEAERERFEAYPFPRFRGTANVARVNRWGQEELRPWLARKRELLEIAEDAYNRVATVELPRWRIAAASQIGDMHLSVAEQMRASPVPDEIRRFPDVLDEYWHLFDEVVDPILEVATARFEHCLLTATNERWFDARSHRCETALNELDPHRFPLASELRGENVYTPAPYARPGRVSLEASGEPTGLEVVPSEG